MEEMDQECVSLDMPNGKSPEIKYEQRFVRPSQKNMPKHQCNKRAKIAPTLEEATKGIYRK